MDAVDQNQLEEQNSNKRLMAESVSIKQSSYLNNNAMKFGQELVTKEQVKNEMQATMCRCTEIRLG